MRTPKAVRIGKLRYKVHTVRALPAAHGAGSGIVEYDKRRIFVATHGGNGRIKHTKKQLDIAVWHEIVHGILNSMKRHALNGNERFVETMAEHLSDVIEHLEKSGHFTKLMTVAAMERRIARLMTLKRGA